MRQSGGKNSEPKPLHPRWVESLTTPEWLPTDPPRVAPTLMTAEEAAIYLRLNEGGRDIADALKSLEYLVLAGRIRPCRVGKHNRYARAELHRFVLEQTEQYGRPRNGTEL